MLITSPSPYSVGETVNKLMLLLKEKGIVIFENINHSKAARDVGLTLRDEVLLIFGDPKVGTYLMQEKSTIGIDLPLKILVWQDENQNTQISYLDPLEIGKIHGIKKNQNILIKMKDLFNKLVQLK